MQVLCAFLCPLLSQLQRGRPARQQTALLGTGQRCTSSRVGGGGGGGDQGGGGGGTCPGGNILERGAKCNC